MYEYIVFRGSDVKELSIVEAPKENAQPQMPDDPAIMGVRIPEETSSCAQHHWLSKMKHYLDINIYSFRERNNNADNSLLPSF